MKEEIRLTINTKEERRLTISMKETDDKHEGETRKTARLPALVSKFKWITMVTAGNSELDKAKYPAIGKKAEELIIAAFPDFKIIMPSSGYNVIPDPESATMIERSLNKHVAFEFYFEEKLYRAILYYPWPVDSFGKKEVPKHLIGKVKEGATGRLVYPKAKSESHSGSEVSLKNVVGGTVEGGRRP